MFVIGQELGQGPEGILLIQEHQQDGSHLAHPLAVTHLLGRGKGGVVNSEGSFTMLLTLHCTDL